ncbi:MAG: hypothetical protein FJW32_07825 [Acidobacteria bacterium]|nr:hypothetical protein [Acidobacteriota bacterium]
MRYLWMIPLAFLLLLAAPPADARPKPRQSSVKSVRGKQKPNLKPLVYDPKKHKAQVVKKRHWWSRR